jgi:hypothetical protein
MSGWDLDNKKKQSKYLSEISHGFYLDNFLFCDACPTKDKCKDRNTLKNQDGYSICKREVDFFNETSEIIKKNFNLTEEDEFQLPIMLFRMIKIKRQNRYVALNGPVGHKYEFNPKTGEKYLVEVPNVISRDVYYAEKVLMTWFDSLRISRASRSSDPNKFDPLKAMAVVDGQIITPEIEEDQKQIDTPSKAE